MQSLLSTWLLTIFYTQMSIWHEERSRHDSAQHFQAGQIGLRYQLLSMGRLISLAECWGLCSQRRVVVLNTKYCSGAHICRWFRYLRFFLLFILEACLSLVICSLLFTTGLLWRKSPINCGFGGMCYHIRVPRVSHHLRLCGRVWGLQASSFKSLPSAKCIA